MQAHQHIVSAQHPWNRWQETPPSKIKIYMDLEVLRGGWCRHSAAHGLHRRPISLWNSRKIRDSYGKEYRFQSAAICMCRRLSQRRQSGAKLATAHRGLLCAASPQPEALTISLGNSKVRVPLRHRYQSCCAPTIAGKAADYTGDRRRSGDRPTRLL